MIMMIWFIVVLLGVLSIVLLTGRGAFLIAGYNTAGEAERSRYNEKLLCRVVGGGLGILTVITAVEAFTEGGFSATTGPLFPCLIVAVILVMLILGNTVCRKKNPPEAVVVNMESAKHKKRSSAITTVVVFALLGILFFTGSVKVSLEDEVLKVHCSYWPGTEIPYDKIENISLEENIHKGSRTFGMGTYRLSAGKWQNDMFGKYEMYANAGCKMYIVMKVENKTIVINAADKEATETLLAEIQKHI